MFTVNTDTFEFEEWRERFPEHWAENGWPAPKSTWRSRLYPHLRVRVVDSGDEYVRTIIHWDGDLDGLRRLFTYEPAERWEIGEHRLVHASAGIGPWEQDGPAGEGRYWRRDDLLLEVRFERPNFGGPDTWHSGEWGSLPFFEPVQDWERGEGSRGP